MLPYHSTPPKEGRVPASYPRLKAKTRQKRMLLRITRFIFVIVAGWLMISLLLLKSPASDAESVRSTSTLVTDRLWQIWPTDTKTSELPVHDATSQGDLDGKPIVENPTGSQENVNSASKDPESPQSSLDNVESAIKDTNPKNPEPDSFNAALDYLLSTIPSELHLRKFLRPVIGTGEKKLHELGLRTRAYKKFFEAWENVHIVNQDDRTYVRDDIVPRIRDRFSAPTFPEALHKYESYRHFLTKFSALLFPWTSPYFADHMSLHVSSRHGGRGIVTTAGNSHAPFLLAAIPSFRLLGCDLPVEVMYLGESDLSKDFRTKLDALPGVTTRDLSAMVNDEGWRLNGWAGKPFSILFSSFREVIFIDADSLFFVNPELLFDDTDYVRTGALFFKDRNILPESDKETFWLGWELAGDTSYAFHPGGSGVMGVLQTPNNFNPTSQPPESTTGTGNGVISTKEGRMAHGHESDITICAPQLLHLDREKRPLWFNGWLYENKYAESKRTIGRFEMFMEEPSESLDPATWQLEESNLCCLSNSVAKEFTEQETEWLGVLIEMARVVES
ncbi:hypothetical protein PENFLA_c004G06259 [Penicillium flavigenum]|uniref:Alpha-1,3-mannosyltransferase n=1 Tax=Penicillium flavigenum TaxID=254877 RepID=A0A1V6TS73_9EURO|nr:hypothetical protein PENFLA_c004G06259 [Penicillium flavigenum]